VRLRRHCFISIIIFSTADRIDSKEYIRKLNQKVSQSVSDVTIPPTPSKNLFSPGLRTDLHSTNESSDNIGAFVTQTVETEGKVSSLSDVDENDKNKSDVEEEEADDDVFNPYHFIAGLPPHNLARILDKVCLPLNTSGNKKITLVLDLDETLVHCTVEPIENPDLVFPVS
jgi:TFIIF-interacting CTD phosphatase-like protein